MGRLERRRRVAGQHVVERPEVSGALDVGVAAQRHDAATGAADVAEDELQHAQRADLLNAVGGLVELERVRGGGRLLGPGGRAVDVGHLEEQVLGKAADLLDHLRRVAGVVPAEVLEDTVRVPQGRVLLGVAALVQLEFPRPLIVGALLRVEAAEEPIEVVGS